VVLTEKLLLLVRALELVEPLLVALVMMTEESPQVERYWVLERLLLLQASQIRH
jgi:hypothetical protein